MLCFIVAQSRLSFWHLCDDRRDEWLSGSLSVTGEMLNATWLDCGCSLESV